MYAGRIVEEGDAREVFSEPAHPYTRELLRSTISLRDDRPQLHPRRAAEPDRPAARLPLPPALPERDAASAPQRQPIEVERRRRPARRLLAARARGRDPGGRHRAARARRDRDGGGGMMEPTQPDDGGPRPSAARGPRPAHALLGAGLVRRPPARPRGRLGEGRRRRQLRPAPGRGARAGRRVGLGQDDARADAARASSQATAGSDPASTASEITGLQRARAAAAAPAAADRLPGPARLAEPGDDDRRRRSATRCASTGSPRARPTASAASPRRSSGSAWRRPRSSSTSTRPTSPAARSSAPCSPGRSSSTPTCWSPTSRSRCST